MIFEFFCCIGGNEAIKQSELEKMGLIFKVIEGEYNDGKSFNMTLENKSDKTFKISRAGVSIHGIKSDMKRDWRVFIDQGCCGWAGVKRLDALEYDPHMGVIPEQRVNRGEEEVLPFHRSNLQTVVWDAISGKAILVGFLRQRHGNNFIDVIPQKGVNDIERIDAWQEFDIELVPGDLQPLDTYVLAEGTEPYCMLEDFGTAVMEHHGKKFDAPPIVGMMTWYGYATAINENTVLENAEIIGELFSGYPQPMQNLMIIDHGWEEDANWGYWEVDKKRFSKGMKWLSNEMAKHKVEPAIWYTPFCITENAPNRDELIKLMAVDREGKPYQDYACVWGDLPGHSRGLWPINILNGADERVQDKWKKEIKTMKEWGTVYWKLDFFALMANEKDRASLGLGELYARTWQNYREAAGEDAHLAPCSCDTNLQLGYCDSVRIGCDIGCAGSWPGAARAYRYGLSTVGALWYKNRKFWVNDADSIQIAKGCSLSEARVRATLVALSGGHLMLSEDLRTVSSERIEIIKRLLPAYPHAARPLDMFENPFPEGYPTFWSLTLDTGFGPMSVLAVFNLTDKTSTYDIKPEMFGLEDGQELLAMEWWQSKWVGRFSGSFTLDVPSEDVAIIHAQPIRDVPWVLSVSHHFTGGYIVENVNFDSNTGILSGELVTKQSMTMVIYGTMAKGWKMSRDSSHHSSVSSCGGWQSEVVTTCMRTPFSIKFEKEN